MLIDILDLGFCPYHEVLEKQKLIREKVSNKTQAETLIFTEHENVYTLGKNANSANILNDYPTDVKIYNIERGGDVTYHGPGQLVGYPILNINDREMSIGSYIHTLENIIISALHHYNIDARIREKLIGVWVGDEKIAAIGVRVKNGVTMHGFAINVSTDLAYFDGIVPCGIDNCKVTSVNKILDEKVNIDIFKQIIIDEFTKHFG